MEEAALIQHSADQPNIFFVVREMPGDYSQWQETLDDDIEIIKTLGISSERKVIFCCSIETACHLYEYCEESLGECAYYDPRQPNSIESSYCNVPYHSESATSVKTTVSTSLCWILVEYRTYSNKRKQIK